jgi:predicted nucleic acid-binding protein
VTRAQQLYLIDNSVLQRISRSPEVERAWRALDTTGRKALCLPSLLEAGYSARDAGGHGRAIAALRAACEVLDPAPALTAISLRLQKLLFEAGMGRAAGVSDLQIAATALHYSASPGDALVTVVHYDADFDCLASVEPALSTRWIVPRGTVN